MFNLTFTLENGTTRHDVCHSEQSIESVKSHYETMIRHGRNNHPFMGKDYKDCVSVEVTAGYA